MDLERFPWCIVPAGSTGTVAEIDDEYIYVTCDDESSNRALHEWEGQVALCNVDDGSNDPTGIFEGAEAIELVKEK